MPEALQFNEEMPEKALVRNGDEKTQLCVHFKVWLGYKNSFTFLTHLQTNLYLSNIREAGRRILESEPHPHL